jgi:hypothetical protein
LLHRRGGLLDRDPIARTDGQLPVTPKVQIFATDIDEAAMGLARAARYLPNAVKAVSPERLRRFFVHEAGSYRVARELRDMCIFSNHSVIRDPPFSRTDLISCRNLLIYLKPEPQSQIIPLFHYATRPGGPSSGFPRTCRGTANYFSIDRRASFAAANWSRGRISRSGNSCARMKAGQGLPSQRSQAFLSQQTDLLLRKVAS